MPNWGLTSAGFVRPRYEEIRVASEASYKATFGGERSTSSDAIDGMLVDYTSEIQDRLWEAMEGVYNSHFLSSVTGVSLLRWAADHGFAKNPETFSVVALSLAGTPGTEIQPGSLVRVVNTGEQFSTGALATIGGGGTVDVAATAVNAGPVAALAATTWAIVNPVSGWDSVSNATDADLGSLLEDDPTFKARIRAATRAGGLALRLARVSGVTAVSVFENDTDIPDATYNATHWVEAMVQGGAGQDIANVLWQYVAEGIGTQGTEAVAESLSGSGEIMNFSRPADVLVYLEVDIVGAEGFDTSIDTTAIRDALVAWGDASHQAGEDVSPIDVATQVAANVTGKFTATIRLDTVNPAVATGILAIDQRSIARLDTSRTTVTVS